MTDFETMSDSDADEMMESVYSEAGEMMSPTITPFLTLGTNDPAQEMMDGPTSASQAEAKDLWQTFGKS